MIACGGRPHGRSSLVARYYLESVEDTDLQVSRYGSLRAKIRIFSKDNAMS